MKQQLFFLFLMCIGFQSLAQYQSFQLNPQGDTINIVDNKGQKQGKWVITVGEVRGEPGYDEEGLYKNNQKEGVWRKYSSTGDIIAVENYLHDGKDGGQQYFSFLGDLVREENWRGYNPDAPYDTIAIYGTESNQVLEYKLVKAQQYSVPHGDWKYYGPGGQVIKIETYAYGRLQTPGGNNAVAAKPAPAKPVEKEKPLEVQEYEKKYSKKKRSQMEREGKTSL